MCCTEKQPKQMGIQPKPKPKKVNKKPIVLPHDHNLQQIQRRSIPVPDKKVMSPAITPRRVIKQRK